MRDVDAFVDLYKRFGVNLKVERYPSDWKIPNGYYIVLSNSYLDSASPSDKFTGYMGFYSVVQFDAEGRFVEQAFAE